MIGSQVPVHDILLLECFDRKYQLTQDIHREVLGQRTKLRYQIFQVHLVSRLHDEVVAVFILKRLI